MSGILGQEVFRSHARQNRDSQDINNSRVSDPELGINQFYGNTAKEHDNQVVARENCHICNYPGDISVLNCCGTIHQAEKNTFLIHFTKLDGKSSVLQTVNSNSRPGS